MCHNKHSLKTFLNVFYNNYKMHNAREPIYEGIKCQKLANSACSPFKVYLLIPYSDFYCYPCLSCNTKLVMAITFKIGGRRGTITFKACERADKGINLFVANVGWGTTGTRLPVQVNAVAKSNNLQVMGLECRNIHGGGGTVMEGRLTGSVFSHGRHQLNQTHPF